MVAGSNPVRGANDYYLESEHHEQVHTIAIATVNVVLLRRSVSNDSMFEEENDHEDDEEDCCVQEDD